MEDEQTGPLLPLNAYLIRNGYTPLTAISEVSRAGTSFYEVSKGHAHPLSGNDLRLLDASQHGDMILAVLDKTTGPPVWQTFLWNQLGLGSIDVLRRSVGAVVFCAVAGSDEDSAPQWVAWTFGTGSRALRRTAQDPRFGLLAVLNLMSPTPAEGDPGQTARPKVREMRYRVTSPYTQQTGHRAAQDIPLESYRLNRATDLIAAVGSTGAVPALSATTLLGGRSVRFRTRVDLVEDLVELGARAVAASRLDNYRAQWPWIDNITLVEDERTIASLREHLYAAVTGPETAMIDAILPDDLIEVGDDRSIARIAFPNERGASQGRKTLAVAAIAGVLRGQESTDHVHALDRDLRFFDDDNRLIGTATILECLSAELRINDRHFVAYDGNFYLVDYDFVARTDRELESIPVSDVEFPAYHGETEPEYNERVRDEHAAEFITIDRKLINIPGETPFEACDLVARCGSLVHVKRRGRSSTLSHLFLQAATSCRLLKESPAARDLFDKLLLEYGASQEIVDQVTDTLAAARRAREEIEIVFAFLGHWKDRGIKSLPLFSRISLAEVRRQINNLGYRTTIKLIPSC